MCVSVPVYGVCICSLCVWYVCSIVMVCGSVPVCGVCRYL